MSSRSRPMKQMNLFGQVVPEPLPDTASPLDEPKGKKQPKKKGPKKAKTKGKSSDSQVESEMPHAIQIESEMDKATGKDKSKILSSGSEESLTVALEKEIDAMDVIINQKVEEDSAACIAEAKQKAKEAQKALDQEDSLDKVSHTCCEDFKTKEKNEGKMETEGKEKKKDEGKKGVETKKEELEANKDVEEGSSQVCPAPKLRRMNASEDLEEVMTVTVPTAPPAEAPAAPQGKEEAMQEAKDEDKDEAGAPPTKQRRLSTKTTVQSHTADDQSE